MAPDPKPTNGGKFGPPVKHSGPPSGPTGCIRCERCNRLIDVDRRHEDCRP
jgi:hypothetical protein